MLTLSHSVLEKLILQYIILNHWLTKVKKNIGLFLHDITLAGPLYHTEFSVLVIPGLLQHVCPRFTCFSQPATCQNQVFAFTSFTTLILSESTVITMIINAALQHLIPHTNELHSLFDYLLPLYIHLYILLFTIFMSALCLCDGKSLKRTTSFTEAFARLIS